MSTQPDEVETKFWMVWKAGGNAPTFRHATLKSAEDEAARLALTNPGKQFFIMESVKFCETESPVRWGWTSEVPF